jgi:uncharacterized membrane protein
MVAKLFGEEPSQQIRVDLRRLKQLLETGEVLSAKSPAARDVPPSSDPQRRRRT